MQRFKCACDCLASQFKQMTCWQTYLYPIQHHGQQHTSHSYVVLYIWLLTLSSILGNTKYRVREGLRIGGILRHFPSSIMRPSSHSVLFDQKNRCFCLPRPPSCSSPPLRIASIVPLFLWFQLLVNLVVALSDNWLHFTRSRQYGSPSQPPPHPLNPCAINPNNQPIPKISTTWFTLPSTTYPN